jgi:DNA-binding Lrp family transcriptional regulator
MDRSDMDGSDTDSIDLEILGLLEENARRTFGDIAERVALSTSAVKRRIDRMEQAGVITGYTVVVDHAKIGRPIQAFTEVRFAGTADMADIRTTALDLPEVQAVFATAGDPDALVWIRVSDVERLGKVIELLRHSGRVTGTKTLMVLETWTRQGALSSVDQ